MAFLSNNTDLPELPFWQARSFWAQLLLAASVFLNAQGVDLMTLLAEMGIGATPDEVIATGERLVSVWQQLAPILFGFWAWIERRAPKFRLVFWRRPETQLHFLGPLAVAALVFMGGVQEARAAAQCLPGPAVREQLADRWAEAAIGHGIAGPVRFEIFVNPETRSWTIVAFRADGVACVLAAGTDWGQPGERL
jgi:hypothetical protein